MIYLSQVLKMPVIDATGTEIGKVSDLAISTGEVFPRITSLAFLGPSKTPFMVSWRKYVAAFGDEQITLNTEWHNIRFSYLQPDEILLARDLMNNQIVDTQGMKVVRVNDLKLSYSGPSEASSSSDTAPAATPTPSSDTAPAPNAIPAPQESIARLSMNPRLRLLGAEVGLRGLLRGISPVLEGAVRGLSKFFGRPIEEDLIAWNYMDLVDRDLSAVRLSVSHKRLHELHPADIADILEQLDPQQRARVFDHLDSKDAAEAVAELEDEFQSDLIDDMSERRASELLAQMEPDDAADILGDLPYEKAEKLLWLMGVSDERRIRSLLGYKENTAGGIMTTQYVSANESQTVQKTIEDVRASSDDYESVHYIYVVKADGSLLGTVSLRKLVLAEGSEELGAIATQEKMITVTPETDEQEVAALISKYDILAIPVIDEESQRLLGIVTIDDAFEVYEEEHDRAKKSRIIPLPVAILEGLVILVLAAVVVFLLLNG
jgi:CBS domain-containing protein/sporulation protein YlmC with PRC-barrel domain